MRWRLLVLTAALVVGLLEPGATQSAPTTDDFFNPEVLQRIDLWPNSRDWEKLKQNFRDNDFYPADITWSGVTVRNVGIRSRGLGSRSGTKPGLEVDIDYYAADQTFLGLTNFILDNLTQDNSGVKETTAMRFFARLGIPASRETHTRLYVNGQYAGVYGLVETVNKQMLARVFGSIGDDVQNDGYLFEYKYQLGSPWRFAYLGSSLTPYKTFFDPKTHEDKSDASKWGPIEELVRLANDTPTSSFEQTVGRVLDLSAFVRFVAAQNFVAENDGFLGYDGMNNFYFYRKENSDQHVFIAWDEDNAFLAPDFLINTRHEENVLWRKLMELPKYKAEYYSVLLEAADLAAQDWADGDGWLGREIRRQLDVIADAIASDPVKPYSNDEHTAGRNALLNFSSARITYVRCEASKAAGRTLPSGCQ
jgi:spore coat protein CotH